MGRPGIYRKSRRMEEAEEEEEEEAAQLTAALQYNTDCESETGFDKDQHPVTLCQCTPM